MSQITQQGVVISDVVSCDFQDGEVSCQLPDPPSLQVLTWFILVIQSHTGRGSGSHPGHVCQDGCWWPVKKAQADAYPYFYPAIPPGPAFLPCLLAACPLQNQVPEKAFSIETNSV